MESFNHRDFCTIVKETDHLVRDMEGLRSADQIALATCLACSSLRGSFARSESVLDALKCLIDSP